MPGLSQRSNKFQAGSWLSSATLRCNPQGVSSLSSQRRRSTEAPSGRLEDFAEEGALERRSVDVGPGAVQSANKEHQMQALKLPSSKKESKLLPSTQSLRIAKKISSIESKKHETYKDKLQRTMIRHKKRLETAKSELNKKRKLNCEAKSQYEKLEADWLKEQETHKDNLQKSMNLQKETIQLKQKLEERDKKIKDLEKSIKDLQGLQHPWQRLSESHRPFIAADAAQPLSSSFLHGKSYVCVAYGKSLDVCAAAPERSASSLPRARSFESGIP
eukprot:g34268.t1